MLPSVSLASSLRSLDRRHVSALYTSLQTAVGSGQTVESLLPLRKVLLPLSHGSLAALQGCSREKLLLHFPSLSNNAIDVLHPWFQMKEDEILSFKSALVSLSVGNFLEVCALIVKQPNVSTLLSIYQEITTPFMLCTPSDTPEQEILSELWAEDLWNPQWLGNLDDESPDIELFPSNSDSISTPLNDTLTESPSATETSMTAESFAQSVPELIRACQVALQQLEEQWRGDSMEQALQHCDFAWKCLNAALVPAIPLPMDQASLTFDRNVPSTLYQQVFIKPPPILSYAFPSFLSSQLKFNLNETTTQTGEHHPAQIRLRLRVQLMLADGVTEVSFDGQQPALSGDNIVPITAPVGTLTLHRLRLQATSHHFGGRLFTLRVQGEVCIQPPHEEQSTQWQSVEGAQVLSQPFRCLAKRTARVKPRIEASRPSAATATGESIPLCLVGGPFCQSPALVLLVQPVGSDATASEGSATLHGRMEVALEYVAPHVVLGTLPPLAVGEYSLIVCNGHGANSPPFLFPITAASDQQPCLLGLPTATSLADSYLEDLQWSQLTETRALTSSNKPPAPPQLVAFDEEEEKEEGNKTKRKPKPKTKTEEEEISPQPIASFASWYQRLLHCQ
jgi:hypothetical protein